MYLDTFQWEEISEDLMQEAAEKTGIDQVCCDTMQYSSVELSEPYYYCPWVAAGAYMTEYEGNLKQFFTEEVKVRQALPDIEKLGELRINGAFALYFGDSAVPTMRERIQNPNVDYREQFETGLKAIEEKYQICCFVSKGISGDETGSDGKGVLFDFSDDMDGVWKRGDIFQSGIYTSELIL